MKKLLPDSIYWSNESIHEYSIDPLNRELYIVGEPDLMDEDGMEPGVEYVMASRVIKNLRILENMSSKPILIHMKTCGGDWTEGIAIYDAIRFCKSHITILSYTHARSMSSLILQAADNRIMMPHSYFLYHHGTYGVSGEWTQAQSIIEWDRQMEHTMLDIYVDKMVSIKHSKYYKNDPSKITKMIQRQMEKKVDVFFTPEETVEMGLADAVFDGDWDAIHV